MILINLQHSKRNEKLFIMPNLSERAILMPSSPIRKLAPLANDAMLEISFDKVGTKKIMANFTPITKLN